MNPRLSLYRALARLPRPRTYLGKFLLTAFLGVHVPLIAVVGYVAVRSQQWEDALPMLLVALVATLVGTLATMYVQGRLLAPVLETSRALNDYVEERIIPALPTEFSDEAGRLMKDAQGCVTHLADLLQLKNDLLATMSHDARSPLTTIMFANDMSLAALNDPSPDLRELREMNEIIRCSARRQLELMNDMMTLARADSGNIQVERGEVAAGELVRRAVENARLQAGQKGLRLVLAPGTGDDLRLEIDPSKTEQVLSNLIHNAIKFTPRGGRVVVAVGADDHAVVFSVRDTGVGIPEQALRELFQPFSNAQRNGTDREAGTGLGLWICKTFVELQGGRVEVESAIGEGSTFRVSFPREAVIAGEKGLEPHGHFPSPMPAFAHSS